MSLLLKRISRFLAAEDGPTAVEYAVMLMLVILVCLSAITLLGENTSQSLTDSSNSLNKIMK
jgi:pilus assembly protein Flp/PilA